MTWVLRTYRSSAGTDEVDGWYRGLSSKLRAKVRVRLGYLRQQPRSQWIRPYFALLSGDCARLGEIRFKLDRSQLRLLGYFGPERLEFTILLVATERDGRFNPRDACITCQRRRQAVQTNQERSGEWLF